jgi:Peptidase family M1 domain
MRAATLRHPFLCCTLTLAISYLTFAAQPAGPNSDPTYQQLRNLTLGSEAISVSNFDLKRDAGTFHLNAGTLCFVPPVNGKVTGAVFNGEGVFVLIPPTDSERASLKLLTKGDEFSETFSQAVFRFTDSTYDEIKKAGGTTTSNCDAGLLKDSQSTTRHKLKDNLEARLLADLLSPEPGGYFVAFVHGKRYNSKEMFIVDEQTTSDQVRLLTYDENKMGEWTAFSVAHPDRAVSRIRYHIEHQQLDTTIEKNAHLSGKAVTTFIAQANGLRVLPFNLFPTLRVSSVTADDGQALAFIQEDKNEDADFTVILPKVLARGEKSSITVSYEGKGAISDEGNGNYFPIARENWYPNSPAASLGEYTTYDMTFRVPKDLTITATGIPVSDTKQGDQDVSVWKSEAPQTVAGFNVGRFKVDEAKLTQPPYDVAAYANEDLPDVARGLYNTTTLLKKALAEGEVSVQVYSDFFGPTPYSRLALTQQTACNFGQSWPSLVWLPICSFFDTTVRHQLHLDYMDRGYWTVVAPHEVAHQWWGHTVGFHSYRDQWMSEGFADFSASLFIQAAYANDRKMYLKFWKDERDLLTERNKEGFRAIDVGPLIMGYRLNNSKAGFNIARDLIYPKGAYVLQMVRMMMWDSRTGDQNFKATMQDFVGTYKGKSATTEDFKAILEKHMTHEMDLEGNHRLDWFFNQYVYGTALPSYKFTSSLDKDANGDPVLSFSLAQSGVDDKFRMLIPIYFEMPDGKTLFLGRARLLGNSSTDQKVPLRGWKNLPKRALINYNYDVLAAN